MATFQPQAGTAPPDDVLARQFRAFLAEVLGARDGAGEAPDGDAAGAARAVQRHLLQWLASQALDAHREGAGSAREVLDEARYLQAAVADEILLHTPWVGRDRWTACLLETALFQTGVAGERVPRRIEQILADRDPSQRALARLYLFALALGFQGRDRGNADAGRLARWRAELHEFIHRSPADLDRPDRVLADEPYLSTLSPPVPRESPAFSRWRVLGLAAIAVLLAVSELLWLWQSWPVRRALSSTSAAVAPAARTGAPRSDASC